MPRCGLGRQAHSAEFDKFPVSREAVSFVSLNAVSSFGMFVTYMPVCVPKFGYWVLCDNSVTELKFVARELWTIFYDFVSIVEPRLHVTCELLVCNSFVVLSGGWSLCPLAPPK